MKPLTTIVAILCITALLLAALKADIDGVLLAGGLSIIAGLGGFATGRFTKPKETEKPKKKRS